MSWKGILKGASVHCTIVHPTAKKRQFNLKPVGVTFTRMVAKCPFLMEAAMNFKAKLSFSQCGSVWLTHNTCVDMFLLSASLLGTCCSVKMPSLASLLSWGKWKHVVVLHGGHSRFPFVIRFVWVWVTRLHNDAHHFGKCQDRQGFRLRIKPWLGKNGNLKGDDGANFLVKAPPDPVCTGKLLVS